MITFLFLCLCMLSTAVLSSQEDYSVKLNTNGSGAAFLRLESDNKLYYGKWDGTFKKIRSKAAATTGAWVHIAIVMNNGEVVFYINGAETEGEYTNGGAPMDNSPDFDNFKIGTLFQNNTFKEAFTGEIDRIALWTTSRTKNEIETEYKNGLTGNENGLWGYWNMDDQQNPTRDSSPNENHLFITNAQFVKSTLDTNPEITEILTGHIKNRSGRGYLTATTRGTLYWVVVDKNTQISIPEEIISSTNFRASGSLEYDTPGRQEFFIFNGLAPQSDYKLFAVLQNEEKKSEIVSTTTFSTSNIPLNKTNQISGAIGVLERLIPRHADSFDFEMIEKVNETNDVFEVSSEGGKIHIKGSSGVALTSGVNWYLKNYCNASFSWNGDQTAIASPLPEVAGTIRKETPYQYRYYLNYTTFNYTMAFWDWTQWEREIDIMAMNGVNLALAIVGQEGVWQNVLRHFGYSNQEILKFLPGPAYQAWWLMGNLESTGGPVSQEYINSRIELQKKILTRFNELGIEPVLQGFYGMVPANFKQKRVDADVKEQGEWFGHTRPAILVGDFIDTVANVWYKETKKLFGQYKYFGGDPFHEGGSTTGIDVSATASKLQNAMIKANPEAVWLLQAWQSNPKDALLQGLKKDQTIVLDYSNDIIGQWKNRNAFNGHPWIYGVINNFGGNVGLYGRLQKVASDVYTMRNSPNKGRNWGIGIAPEGIIYNSVSYDLIWDLAWDTTKINIDNWIENYAANRYGIELRNTKDAWKILSQNAYNCDRYQEGTTESVINGRPSKQLERVSCCSTTELYYKATDLIPAWDNMIHTSDVLRDKSTFQYDIVDLSRQVLSNYAKQLYEEVINAFDNDNTELFVEKNMIFLELIDDQDTLLGTREEFLFGKWVADARAIATNENEADLFEKNARYLVTLWSEPGLLHEYAHKDWAGLTRFFYKKRWELFFSDLKEQLEQQSPNTINFYKWEKNWIENLKDNFNSEPEGDPVEVSRYIYKKYRNIIGDEMTNHPHEINSDEFFIDEKSQDNDPVGKIRVIDPDQGQNHTFSIFSQSHPNTFQIDRNTGEISVKNSAILDAESTPLMSIIIRVTDSGTSPFDSYKKILVHVTQSTSTVKSNKYNNFNVYMHSADSKLIIELPQGNGYTIAIFNLFGSELYKKKMSNTQKLDELSTSDFRRGIYIVTLTNECSLVGTRKVFIDYL